jgi:diguanylate cyclase (GGDEF)-like protein
MTAATVPQRDETLAAVALLDLEADAVADDWRELCRWDPELPPGTEPPDAESVVAALVDALRRPQPLGWGADEGVVAAMTDFTERAGALAIAQLICLREAVSRRLRGRLPQVEADETWSRLQMTIDRAMLWATRRAFAQLERDARVDVLTGVLNRRAFVIEMRRELSRVARRHGRFILVMLDVDGLKAINDTLGHNAGDAHLQALGAALRSNTRKEDSAYRLGGDEFAICLPEASLEQAEAILTRVAQAAATPFSWGLSSCPDDGDTVDALVAAADTHLYQRRANTRPRKENRCTSA